MTTPVDDAQLQELAQAYALGECDQTDLQRLYDCLRSDDQGERAARLTWEAVRMRGDLRTSLSPEFRMLIEDRLGPQDESGSGGFLRSILSGIGLQRPRLRSVHLPAPERPSLMRRLLLPLVLLAILACGLVLGLLWSGRSPVTIVSHTGRVLSDGGSIRSGDRLESGLVLGPGAEVLLRWQDGHEALIQGPATCFGGDDTALRMRDGRIRLRNTGPFRIGLPDRSIRLHSAADATLQAIGEGDGILLGLEHGTATLSQPGSTSGVLLGGEEWSDGLAVYRWIDEREWHGRPVWPDPAPVWRCRLDLAFDGPDASAHLVRDDQTLLVCTPAGLFDPSDEEHLPTGLPPRQVRSLVLLGTPAGVHVRMLGGDGTMELPPQSPPQLLRLEQGARQLQGRLGTGPAPLSWP